MQLLRRRQPRTGSFLQHVSTFGAAAALLWACDTYTPDLLEGDRTDPLDNETDATDPDDEPTPATGSMPVSPSTPITSPMPIEPDPTPAVGGDGNSGSGNEGGAGNGGTGSNNGTGNVGIGGAIPPVSSGGTAPMGTGGTAPMPSGSGGSTVEPMPSGSGGSTPGPAPTVVVPTTNPRLIDDFEDGNNGIAMVDGRMGYWFTTGSTEGTIDTFAVSPLDPTNAGNAASTRGVHVTALDFTGGDAAYALLGVNFNGEEMPYPGAASYSGIQFWARSSGGADANIVAVKLPTTATQTDSDHFGFHSVTLTDAWQEILIPFNHAMLVQQGFGAAQTFDPAQLIGIQFSLAPGRTGFDLWIDDVTFAE